MNGRQFATLALGAAMLAPILSAPVMRAPARPAAVQPETWAAVVQWDDGNADIVEHGVTLPDCRAALEAWETAPRVFASRCERET